LVCELFFNMEKFLNNLAALPGCLKEYAISVGPDNIFVKHSKSVFFIPKCSKFFFKNT